MPQYTRRRLIATGLSAASVSAISGCLSSGGSTDGATAQASFFVFGDFASEVAGDVTTAETLVPVGQHGHGWEPGPQIQGTIRDSELFIYGMEGFQPWADDIAESYRSRLDELDSSFESTPESASKDVVFVAGHNAFQYLGQRYGFEVRTLTGLSPDDQPTPEDIERAQDIIAEHDLEYVRADPLESQQAANQLVAETDATEVLPLTPIPGQTQEWADRDWGYVEIMENVNLETLGRALDA